MMQVKRRVKDLVPVTGEWTGRYKTIQVDAVLEKSTPGGAMVRLSNGDVIFRKKRDIVE